MLGWSGWRWSAVTGKRGVRTDRLEIVMSFDTRLPTGAGVLAAVTETGNFARAAEMLGLTPSGVSRAVARLETRVGVRLFNRNPREVTLTEEGHRFHAQVMPLLVQPAQPQWSAVGCACPSIPGSHGWCLRRAYSNSWRDIRCCRSTS
jgi:hypothetical protein